MADCLRSGGGVAERDIDQAITALKKGAYLLKYGRRGKPKFCPFHLSSDESSLIWYSGKEEKQLKLSQVSKIIPGQRTAIFQRYPRPEKEYQSFSLIYNDRSLDLICKDKDEAEVWLVGLKALISRGSCYHKWKIETKSDSVSSDSPRARIRRSSPTITPFDPGPGDGQAIQGPFGKAFSDIISYTAAAKTPNQSELVANPLGLSPAACADDSNGRSSTADAVRVSLSSAVSSSSQGSSREVFDALGDVFIWGEGIRDGMLGGGVHRIEDPFSYDLDALLPKALESTGVLDVQNIACGHRHAVLVTKQGEIFSWGEESGGRLGHGIEADISHPKLIYNLSGMNVELVACGGYHTCAITSSGDLYTWGDGIHNSGLLGHGSEASHWIPKRVCGDLDGVQVSYISCGPWHTAAVTSTGQLFTFGDGTFGALGHGDLTSTTVPREVETLRGQRTLRVACGVWHTAAVVEGMTESSSPGIDGCFSRGQLFTWGNGDKCRLGHGDNEPRLIPTCVAALVDENICQVACGHNLTVALTLGGEVYTMGSSDYGQLGCPKVDGKVPTLVEGKISGSVVESIACGSYHVAVLTSKTEVYTWGKGTNGQLGHGDNKDRNIPTRVNFLKDKKVKNLVCGSNFTAVICLHQWVSKADHLVCSGCHNPFTFRRKRHNCYNCGLVFCNACSNKKSLKASLAPNMNKPYRVCDDCFNKLKKALELSSAVRLPKARNVNMNHRTSEVAERESLSNRLQTQISRISSAESTSQAGSWHSMHDGRVELDKSCVFPAQNGNLQFGVFHSSKVSTFIDVSGATRNIIPNSTPGSRLASHTPSPFSGRTSSASARSSEANVEDLMHLNACLSEEIISLRAQVEDLTSKSHHLEAELEAKSRKLEEVAAVAAGEAEKLKSAKEVIKSLSAQLKERGGLPEGHVANHIVVSKWTSSVEKLLSHEIESNGNSLDHQILSSGTKTQNEWVVQAEPGVYITLASLTTGANELKRVRFSRKHFTEQQAEQWWAENGAKVCELHHIQSSE